jgi:hypothetical protein
MWKMGLRPRNSQKRNTYVGFSFECGMSVLQVLWCAEVFTEAKRRRRRRGHCLVSGLR